MAVIKFYKIKSDAPAAQYLANDIAEKLSIGQKVLWLVPGGSAIRLVVQAARLLQNNSHLANLTVTLTDERFGPVGHRDSNWHQLKDAGFELQGATMVPVLTGKDIAATSLEFNNQLSDLLEIADYRIGLLGIGEDGHTAGILPSSPAVNSQMFVEFYNSPPYQRITTTPPFLAKLNEAVIYAVGQNKWPILKTIESTIDLDEQPAQALKQVPKLTIFNDWKGQEL